MDKFLTAKKRVADEPTDIGGSKKLSNIKKDSFNIVTMNSNSLANRVSDKATHADIMAFVALHSPDVIAVQEVRLPAKTFSSNPKKGDGSRRDRSKVDDRDPKTATDKRLLQSCLAFKDYQQHYSLSDWRYAGSMVALKKTNDPPLWVAFTFESAERESVKHQWLRGDALPPSDVATSSDAATSQAPSSREVAETDIPTPDTAGVYESRSNMDGHSADGRVICMGFPSFDLLATYSPNNGSSEPSFNRRRLWDKDVELFFTRAAGRCRPMVWVGDLNVAHTPADVTHPSFFSSQMLQPVRGDSGQAGYTPNERQRFSDIISGGRLVDTYRHFHPVSATSLSEDISMHPPGVGGVDTGLDSLGPNYTWRGAAGTHIAEAGRFYGKGMRIDYAMVSEGLLPLVRGVHILGRGRDFEGFLGSDHCPVMVTLETS